MTTSSWLDEDTSCTWCRKHKLKWWIIKIMIKISTTFIFQNTHLWDKDIHKWWTYFFNQLLQLTWYTLYATWSWKWAKFFWWTIGVQNHQGTHQNWFFSFLGFSGGHFPKNPKMDVFQILNFPEALSQLQLDLESGIFLVGSWWCLTKCSILLGLVHAYWTAIDLLFFEIP